LNAVAKQRRLLEHCVSGAFLLAKHTAVLHSKTVYIAVSDGYGFGKAETCTQMRAQMRTGFARSGPKLL
jgi:hypothetical protein